MLDAQEPVLRTGGIQAAEHMRAQLDAAAPGWASAPQELKDFLHTRFVRSSASAILGMADGLRHEPDRVTKLSHALRALDAPCLVLCGADDDAWSVASQRDMADRLDADFAVIPDANTRRTWRTRARCWARCCRPGGRGYRVSTCQNSQSQANQNTPNEATAKASTNTEDQPRRAPRRRSTPRCARIANNASADWPITSSRPGPGLPSVLLSTCAAIATSAMITVAAVSVPVMPPRNVRRLGLAG